MFKPVESKTSFPEMEKRILQLWRCYCLPEQSEGSGGVGQPIPRFFAEFILSTRRFFASLRMTWREGLRIA